VLKKAAEKRKPVVILKGGRSEIGAVSAASHTGNLAGSKEAYDAVFRKFGVIQVEDLEQFICMSQTLSVLNGHLPKKPTYAGINLSGGENTLFADLAAKYQVELPELSDETKAEMKQYLPGFATPKNPLDATTALFRNEGKVIGLLKALENEPDIGGVVLGGNIGMKFMDIWEIFCQSIAKAKEQGFTKPAFVMPPYEATRHPEYRKILESAGIPLMSAVSTGMQCLSKLADFVKYNPEEKTLKIAAPQGDLTQKDTYALSEYESKNELSAVGLPIPSQKLVKNAVDLSGILEELLYPLALKISSPDILHKSDIGAVKLNIANAEEASSAYEEILANVSEHAPDAALEGILVQEMADPGVEMIIGVTSDVQFGPMLMVGMGGVFVEIFKDVALAPVPICKPEALDMLHQLKGYKLLSGYRGEAPCDVEALADMMVSVSDYANKNKNTLKEMDLNPVFVYPEGKGVCAADAVLVKYEDEG
jgi:acetate---CoA ligase (ADP-forming)